jgi:O-antigen ligase
VVAIILIAVIATRVHEVLPFVTRLRPALTVGLGGTLLVIASSRQEVLGSVASHPGIRLLVALFAWAALTAPFALWPGAALSSAWSLSLPILMMSLVVLACEPSERNLHRLKLGFVTAAALHGLLLLPGRMVGARLGSVSSLDANDLATLMVICFPFSVSMALHARGMRRWLAVGAAVVFLTVVVLSGSRGGTVALAVCGLAYIMSAKGRRRMVALVVLLSAGSLTWGLAPQSFRERIESLSELETDYNTTDYTGRKQVWARARIYIRQHPLTGVGINNFPVAEGNYLTESGRRGKWSTTHNTYLQVTSELGFVGGGIFIAFLGLACMRALALRRPTGGTGASAGAQPEFMAALAGFAAGAYFLSHAYFYAFYALAALTFFAYRVRLASRHAPQATSVPTAGRSRGPRGFRSLRTAHISR